MKTETYNMNYKSKLTALILFLSILSNTNSVQIKRFINSTPFEIEVTDNVEGTYYTLEPEEIYEANWDVSLKNIATRISSPYWDLEHSQFRITIMRPKRWDFLTLGLALTIGTKDYVPFVFQNVRSDVSLAAYECLNKHCDYIIIEFTYDENTQKTEILFGHETSEINPAAKEVEIYSPDDFNYNYHYQKY